MKIYVIRHGETDGNKEGVLQGWLDNPLNEYGRRLARDTGRAIKDVLQFDAVFSSPLKRAYETAQLVLSESGQASLPITADDRLKEICCGEWEGKRFGPGGADAGELTVQQRQRFFGDPLHSEGYPGGEDVYAVMKRTRSFLEELAQRTDLKSVLVSTHGCALRCMLNHLYENPLDFWQGHIPYNCSVSILEATDGKLTLLESDRIYYDPADIIDRYTFVR